MQRKSKVLAAVISITILVSGGIYYWQGNKSDDNAEIIMSTEQKTYISPEHNFSLKYPSSWQIFGKEGVTITANDDDDAWGGTNLNLQYDFEAGDPGLGLKEFKNEEYTNPSGIKFTLSFNAPDQDFIKKIIRISDPKIYILIGTDAIPGLKMFIYSKSINPNGEKQLMDILASVTTTK